MEMTGRDSCLKPAYYYLFQEWNDITVVGIKARDGGDLIEGEQLMLSSNTLLTYVAESYRVVFVLDISPSTFIVVCFSHIQILFSGHCADDFHSFQCLSLCAVSGLYYVYYLPIFSSC